MEIAQSSGRGATLLLVLVLVLSSAGFGQTGDHAESVNPLIGTGKGPGDSENLFPGAVMPFGMVQLSPDTEDHGLGYHYYQPVVKGFSMTHMSGVGCPNEGEVFLSATTGPVGTQESAIESPYTHDHEAASPGYYQVLLQRWNVKAELTATERTGMVRFTFPANEAANVMLPISHTLNNTSAAEVRFVNDREIEGYVENQVFCGAKATYRVYFVVRFDEPFGSSATWNSSGGADALSTTKRSEEQTTHGQWIGAYASWPGSAEARSVTARIGISYVDLAGARNNLGTESQDKPFEQIRAAATAAWNRALGTIEVTGGSKSQREVFYTALYHSLLMPSILSDADGRYLGFDAAIHHVEAGHLIYGNFSGWDIYRTQIPLVALLQPARTEDMAESVALMYQQGGWIGRWPQINGYTNVMAGSPLSIIVSTAWLDGLHGFDIETAWEGMLLDATRAAPPGKPYEGEVGMQWINSLHYTPSDKVNYGSVSQIQEDALAYASLYRLAKALNKPDDAALLYDRALYYRNVFNAASGFFQPRNADGSWVPGFDPAQNSSGFIEGSGWHYQWFAPADLSWLVNAMGRERFNKRLTHFFDYETPVWFGQYYNPYNETDLQAPYEFNFSGQPWQTQRVVRRILAENYDTTADGIPGNDDCGEMSSWAVMSMMGIYPVDPSSLAYELTSPVFSKVVLHLAQPHKGRTFTIEASPNPASLPYIQSVQLNHERLSHDWIPYEAITNGGVLHYELGPNPNKVWGAGKNDAPPSLSDRATP